MASAPSPERSHDALSTSTPSSPTVGFARLIAPSPPSSPSRRVKQQCPIRHTNHKLKCSSRVATTVSDDFERPDILRGAPVTGPEDAARHLLHRATIPRPSPTEHTPTRLPKARQTGR